MTEKKCCPSHEDFVAALKGAPQDVSLPVIEDYIGQGYTDWQWNVSPSATDPPCLAKDGERGALADFVLGLVHAAPIYEKTHPGCHCTITISGEGLPDVVISAFGVQ